MNSHAIIGTNFNDLNADEIANIAAHLPFKDIKKLLLVNKTLYNFASNNDFFATWRNCLTSYQNDHDEMVTEGINHFLKTSNIPYFELKTIDGFLQLTSIHNDDEKLKRLIDSLGISDASNQVCFFNCATHRRALIVAGSSAIISLVSLTPFVVAYSFGYIDIGSYGLMVATPASVIATATIFCLVGNRQLNKYQLEQTKTEAKRNDFIASHKQSNDNKINESTPLLEQTIQPISQKGKLPLFNLFAIKNTQDTIETEENEVRITIQ